MKIGYVVLAHQDPDLVARMTKLLINDGGLVCIHWDMSTSPASFQRLKDALGEDASRVLWPKRTKVGWGEWSITEATLYGLEAIEASGETVDYVQLLSGSDYPIRSLEEYRDYISRTGGDFIECYDMQTERWIKGGITHERYLYRHPLNERAWPKQFRACWKTQRRLGLKRRFPKGLKPYVGSQWWTLRWSTCELVLAASRNRAYRKFFETVWIPDEMFIQSVVGSLVPACERRRFSLTYFEFTDYGKPIVLANDHLDFLQRQPFFFARKISPHAEQLREALDLIVSGVRQIEPLDHDTVGQRTTEYEQVRISRRQTGNGRRTMGQESDGWRGDLSWHVRPHIAVLGASLEELRLIQKILGSTGMIEAHGALFAADRIDFAGQRQQYAGYGAGDTKLRDHRQTTFLSDVINCAAPRTTSLLLPWKPQIWIQDVLLHTQLTCVLAVRGNVFRAFDEHSRRVAKAGSSDTDPAAARRWVSPAEIDAFTKEYDNYYWKVWDTSCKSGLLYQEVSLMRAGWLERLLQFLDCSVVPISRQGNPEPMAPIRPEWVERMGSELSDPGERISNMRGLMEMRLKPEDRDIHREVLLAGRRVASPLAPIEAVQSARLIAATAEPRPRRRRLRASGVNLVATSEET